MAWKKLKTWKELFFALLLCFLREQQVPRLKNMRETVFFFEDECFCTEMRVLERGVEIVG